MKNCYKIDDCDHVKITKTDGAEISGTPICLYYADETDSGEDEIAIENTTGIYTIRESEIESWQKMTTID